MTLPERIQPEDVVVAMIAGLAAVGTSSLRLSEVAFQRAFAEAVIAIAMGTGPLAQMARLYQPNPLTGSIPLLDEGMIAAEGYGLIRFPNPSYGVVHLTLTRKAALAFLNRFGEERANIERAADAFLAALRGSH